MSIYTESFNEKISQVIFDMSQKSIQKSITGDIFIFKSITKKDFYIET